jgi:hypothetical protein
VTRWFRFYDEALNDPKILKLSDKLFRVWVGLLCVASKNDGKIPPMEDTGLMLRMKPEKLSKDIADLMSAGLLDDIGGTVSPHNWSGRQYKSDSSTDRVKRFRNGGRNVSSDVSETAPETEQIQKQRQKEPQRGEVSPLEVVDEDTGEVILLRGGRA